MSLIFSAWAMLVLGAVPAVLWQANGRASIRFTGFCHALACALIALTGGFSFAGRTWDYSLVDLPYVGSIHLAVDNLTAVFLLILGIVGFSANWFAISYQQHYRHRWNFHWLAILNGFFLFSMSGVFLAQNVLLFLFCWEMMALSSFGLVVVDSRHEEQRNTGFVYLTMSHVAAAFLFLALIWPAAAGKGGFDFGNWLPAVGAMDAWSRNFIFASLFIGFGTKAGMVPLHVWLPRAHPQAPSDISALMSGVMVKTGIYGILRFMAVPYWEVGEVWGWVFLLFGITSALLGVLYAINEKQIKSLLAYSTVENVGIIFLAIGMGLIFRAYDREPEATLALTAAVFHSFNHALFKSLLFMGAGAVQSRTHTGKLDELGGLARSMPIVSVLFFIGAIALSGLPPTNGFASEWLIYRSLIAGFALPSALCKIAMPILAAVLALTGALASGCFVKAFGAIFLGKPRSHHAQNLSEPNTMMLVGMGIPAVFCLVIGVFPELVLAPLARFDGRAGFVHAFDAPLSWITNPGEMISTFLLLACLIVGFGVAWLVFRYRSPAKETEIWETWNCGTPLTSRMSYTASAFSEPFIVNFSSLFAPKRQFRASGSITHFIPERITYSMKTRRIFEEILYRPVVNMLLRLSLVIQKMQSGSLQVYLLLMFLVIVLLLVFGG